MGKKSPSAPAAPDPVAVSQAQGAANADTARLQGRMNMVDQVTPYGNLTYEDLGNDRYRATTQLTPNESWILKQGQDIDMRGNDIALAQLNRVGDTLSAPVNFDGAPDASNRKAVEDAMYARINPSLDQARTSLEGRLKNQGLTPGTEAWNNAMRDSSQRENDARLAVTANAGSEEDRLMRQRQQYIQEVMTKRQAPINETTALLGLGQLQMPNFVNTPTTQVQPTDVMGAYGLQQSALNAGYQGKIATQNSQNQAMGQMGGAAVGLTAAAIIA